MSWPREAPWFQLFADEQPSTALGRRVRAAARVFAEVGVDAVRRPLRIETAADVVADHAVFARVKLAQAVVTHAWPLGALGGGRQLDALSAASAGDTTSRQEA